MAVHKRAAHGYQPTQITTRAVVTRCGCGSYHRGQWVPAPVEVIHRAHGWLPNGNLAPCPTPRAVEDHGIIAYHHRNPLRRLWFALQRALGVTVR